MTRLLMSAAGSGASGDLITSYIMALREEACTISRVHLNQNCRTSLGDLTHRVLRRYLPQFGYNEANHRLLTAARDFQPDVVWLFKGMQIYPRTLAHLHEANSLLVNYNADHPFEYFSRGSGNINVLRSIPFFDLHMTYSQHIANRMREEYPGVAVAVVPFGHDVDDDVYASLKQLEEIPRAGFIGNPDKDRSFALKALADAGVPVDVFGHNWERFLTPTSTLRLMGPADGQAMLRALRAYRVQLNFLRPHNQYSHNMRTFEVPACGGIMLAEDTIEHRAFFENEKEAFYFVSQDQMIERARELLSLSSTDADRIRKAARRRCVRDGYSYRKRALTAFGEITKLMRAN